MTPGELAAQSTINQMNMQSPPLTGGMGSTFGLCKQCGFSHPPIPDGSICPNAGVVVETAGGVKKELNIEQYLVTLKNIIVSQISMKKIQEPDKLFKNITIEVTKYLETYIE